MASGNIPLKDFMDGNYERKAGDDNALHVTALDIGSGHPVRNTTSTNTGTQRNTNNQPSIRPRNAVSLRNESYFPMFNDLFDEHDPCDNYYPISDGGSFPVKHWCYLGEIVNYIGMGRHHTEVRDKTGHKHLVSFYQDNGVEPTTFQWSDLKVGNTVCIRYAEIRHFMDGQVGIRVEQLDNVLIIPCKLQTLYKLSDDYTALKQKSVDQKCFYKNCSNKDAAADKHCARCQFAMYCCKQCQADDWVNHKLICKSVRLYEELVNLDYTRWEEYESFKRHVVN